MFEGCQRFKVLGFGKTFDYLVLMCVCSWYTSDIFFQPSGMQPYGKGRVFITEITLVFKETEFPIAIKVTIKIATVIESWFLPCNRKQRIWSIWYMKIWFYHCYRKASKMKAISHHIKMLLKQTWKSNQGRWLPKVIRDVNQEIIKERTLTCTNSKTWAHI